MSNDEPTDEDVADDAASEPEDTAAAAEEVTDLLLNGMEMEPVERV